MAAPLTNNIVDVWYLPNLLVSLRNTAKEGALKIEGTLRNRIMKNAPKDQMMLNSDDNLVDIKTCPDCGFQYDRLLEHIRKSKNCNVSEEFYYKLRHSIDMKRKCKIKENVEKWRKLNPKKAKKQTQKGVEKWRKLNPNYAKVQRWQSRKKMQRKAWKRKLTLNNIEWQIKAVEYKRTLLRKIAGDYLMHLSIGRTPFFWDNPQHTLLNSDYSNSRIDWLGGYADKCILTEEASLAWVKGINPMVLEAIMTYQNVISVSKTTWEKAIKKARKNDEMKEKLLKLVGQLQAHNHSQTKNISIPKEFNVICKQSEATRWEGYYKCWKSMEIFTQEDEELLIGYINNILGGKFQII